MAPCPAGARRLGAALVLVAGSILALADEVELKSGDILTGRVVKEDEERVVLDRGGGNRIEVPRDQVKEVRKPGGGDRSPADPPAGGEAPPGAPPPAASLVARVGPGGVTRPELNPYLARFGRPEDWEYNDAWAKAIPLAIDDELLLQGAIADGILADGQVRAAVLEAFETKIREGTRTLPPLSEEGLGALSPEARERVRRYYEKRRRQEAGSAPPIPEAELRAYYEAHRDRFARPANVQFEFVGFRPGVPAADLEPRRDALVAKADAEGAWGLAMQAATKGGAFMLLPRETVDALADYPVGQVSPVLALPAGGCVLLRARKRVEARTLPFEEAKDEIRAAILAGGGAGGSPAAEEETRFQAALRAGVPREPQIRRRIVDAWLKKTGLSSEAALPDLRNRFPVQILLDAPP